MNYETATDFELNRRLLELSCDDDVEIINIRKHNLSGKLTCFSHAVFTAKHDSVTFEEKVNFCTDWNATMPLAVEHKVSIIPSIKEDYYRAIPVIGGAVHSKKPLRAIAICLIKVLESKQ